MGVNEKRIGQNSRHANHNVKRLVPDGDVKSITLKTGQFYARCLKPSVPVAWSVRRSTPQSGPSHPDQSSSSSSSS